MKTITLILVLFFPLAMMAQTATDGDYRSVQTGNWSAATTWQVRAGAAWATPAAGPTAANNVYLQPGFTVTVDVASAFCNDLQANTAGIVTIGLNTLNVNGKMRGYTGTVVTSAIDDVFYTSQANATALNNTMITTTSPGVLKIVGATRTFMNTAEWLASGMISCNIEFALNAGATATIVPSFKFRSVIISSGKVDCGSGARIGADDNVGTGFLTIKNGATLTSARSGLTSQVISAQSASACGTVTIEAGATLELTGTTPAIDATGFINNGTVIYSRAGAQNLLQKGSAVGSVDMPAYSSLILSVSNSKTFTVATTVSTLLQINGTATIVPTAVNTLTMLNGSTVDRSGTGTSIPSTPGAVFYGTASTDLVNVTIGANVSVSNELPAAPTPGKIGALTIKPGFTYTITGGRTVTDVVNNNLIVLSPSTTLTFTINGNISGAGTITGHSSASIAFSGANNGDGGTLNLTAGSQVANTLTVNRTGTAAFIGLGNAVALNGNLTLTAGTLKGGSNIITVAGNVQGSSQGIYTATTSGKVVMTGNAGVATISSATLDNLELNNVNGFLLSGSPVITGTLTSTNGQLDLAANNLTLRSTATTTARFAPTALAAPFLYSSTGKIIVERYISNIGRKWRLLSARSTVSTQTIFDSWQEAGGTGNNLGTWITAPGGGNGFDGSSNSASILKHNQATPAWVGLTATNTGSINDEQAYMLFVRGDRNDNAGNASNAATVLRTAGQLRVGTQAAVIVSASGTGRTLVGNPFASPINMETIFTGTTNLDQNMYVWDATLTGNFGVGGYRSVVRTGVNTYDQTPVVLGGTTTADPTIQFIHSGQAVFLKATGADANVIFTESMKATTPTTVYNPIVATSGDQQIIANLMVVDKTGGADLLADGIRVRFNNTYQSATTDDIEKMGNFGENLSSYRNGKKLIVEQRPMIAENDTIFLRITNASIKDYRLQIGTIDFVQAKVTAYLQDIYLNKTTALDVAGKINEIDFSVTADAASANPDRFKIIFKGEKATPVIFTHVKATQTAGSGVQNNHVVVWWQVSNQADVQQYEVERSADGVNFTKMVTQTASVNNGTYNWLDTDPSNVNNFYRIRSISINGDEKISEQVNVKIVTGKPGISCYPNPVVNGMISLRFTNMQKGNYQARLINTAGVLLFTQNIFYAGDNAVQTLKPVANVATGNYVLDIVKPDNSHVQTAIVIIN
jgi:trimeric autotransporter adhesin